MEALIYVFSWGSPLGLGGMFFLAGIGAGVFFWGFSHFMKQDKKDKEE